jgi:hypothetical protein
MSFHKEEREREREGAICPFPGAPKGNILKRPSANHNQEIDFYLIHPVYAGCTGLLVTFTLSVSLSLSLSLSHSLSLSSGV